MTKKLFMDLDECMVHSLYADNEKHADQLIDMYGEYWRGEKYNVRVSSGAWDYGQSSPYDSWHVSFLRPLTKDLLIFARQVFGNDNVYMLSTGILDYIRTVNIILELGFDPNINIFGREDIKRHTTHPKFKDTFNVLVDNEDYEYHSLGVNCKVNWLNVIPPEQLVQINEFTVWKPDDDEYYLENVKDRILTAFNM
jgi:hypothetical protein